jgi:2-polyprenyl-6-methoxyphenol hydroxylase-like FAD-dependent oxidoreductase
MTEQHFDVAVLGRSAAGLAAAALLAQRGYRTVVLGHGQRPCTYHFRDVALRRRAFLIPTVASPALQHIVGELGQAQVLRRKLVALDPMFQSA